LLGRKKMRVCGCLLAGIAHFDVRPVVALHSHRSTINPAHPLFGCAFFQTPMERPTEHAARGQ
jgi:hypothetical protein